MYWSDSILIHTRVSFPLYCQNVWWRKWLCCTLLLIYIHRETFHFLYIFNFYYFCPSWSINLLLLSKALDVGRMWGCHVHKPFFQTYALCTSHSITALTEMTVFCLPPSLKPLSPLLWVTWAFFSHSLNHMLCRKGCEIVQCLGRWLWTKKQQTSRPGWKAASLPLLSNVNSSLKVLLDGSNALQWMRSPVFWASGIYLCFSRSQWYDGTFRDWRTRWQLG